MSLKVGKIFIDAETIKSKLGIDKQVVIVGANYNELDSVDITYIVMDEAELADDYHQVSRTRI